MRVIYILVFIFSSISISWSVDPSPKNANAALKNESYQEALQIYNDIIASGNVNPDMYYNMATAYYSLGRTGDAVLYLQKTLQYKPYDKSASDLYLSVLKDNADIEPATSSNFIVRSIKIISSFFMPLTWLIIAVLCLIPVAIFIFKNPSKTLKFNKYNSYIILCSALFITFSFLGLYRNQQIFQNTTVVITTENTVLKVGPDQQSPNLDTLSQGSVVYYEDNLSGWWQVRTPYGDEGWIEAVQGKRL